MTRLIVIAIVISLVLPLTAAAQDACTFDFSEIIPMLESAQTAADVAEARALIELQEARCTGDQDDAGSSRINPVPFGDTGIVAADDFDASIQLLGYVDDGEEILLNANDRNDPAPNGKRYVLVAFTFACVRSTDESCEYSRVHFSIVGDKGIAYDYDTVDLHSGSVSDSQEIFGGGSATIGIAFLVDDDDDNFVMFTEYARPRMFFATE